MLILRSARKKIVLRCIGFRVAQHFEDQIAVGPQASPFQPRSRLCNTYIIPLPLSHYY